MNPITWSLSLSAALLLSACAPPGSDVGSEDASSAERSALGEETYAVDISLWSGEITDAELACWWNEGVRHVVVGNQNPRISRQQLDASLAAGMTIDLYVYLMWNESMSAQVEEALDLADEYPEVGRLWLDVEDPSGGYGANALIAKVEAAVQACGDFPCGIYTGKGFWQSAMGGTTRFAHVPLWYAWYDLDPSMSTWQTQRFGGWVEPTAKQWQETYLCGIDVDKNTMLVDAEPLHDPPEPAPDLAGAPAAPTGMYPDDLQPIETETVRMLVATPQVGVTRYAFEIQSWNGSAWAAYTTYHSPKNGYRFSPAIRNRAYRFRARAQDGSGWGAWSDWGEWTVGKPTRLPPADQLDPSGDTEPPPPPPPPPPPDGEPGGPTPLSPSDGATLTSSSVTLTCSPVDGATQYAFEIERLDPATSTYTAYYTYTSSSPSRTFYPQSRDRTYRWRVRATVAGSATPSSGWSSFVID